MKDILLDNIIEFEVNSYKQVFNQPISSKELELKRSFYKKVLKDERSYIYISKNKEGLDEAVVAIKKDHILAGEIANVLYCYKKNNEYGQFISEHVKKIKDFYNLTNIYLEVLESDKHFKKTCLENNFECITNLLIGDVSYAYDYLQPQVSDCYYNKFKIDKIDTNDIDEIVKVNREAIESDFSCFRGINDIVEDKTLKESLNQNIPLKSALKLVFQNQIIGFIIYSKHGIANNIFHFCGIGITPDFKGKGLSKFLYFKAMSEMKKIGVEKYSGFSATSSIMYMAKKMRRVTMKSIYRTIS